MAEGHPHRIYVDLDESEIGAAVSQQALASGPVRQIRVGQFRPTQARVVLDLTRATPYTVRTLEHPFRIVLRVADDSIHTTGRYPSNNEVLEASDERPRQESGTNDTLQARPAESIPTHLNDGDPQSDSLPLADAADESSRSLVPARDRERLRQIAAARRARPLSEDYIIGADDLLEITIPDLADDPARGSSLRLVAASSTALSAAPAYGNGVRVSGEGDVTLPLLGAVRAAGLTPGALEQQLKRRLIADGILRRPDVHVFVAEYRSRVVSVIGAVARPGLYPLTGPDATLSEMLWAAGGPSDDAGRVIAFAPSTRGAHTNGGALEAPIFIDLETLLERQGDEMNDPPVRPRDVIKVSPAGSINVDGWVAKPGSYSVTRGLTVSGAIAAAGGHLFPADLDEVDVLRTFGAGEQERVRVDIAAVRAGEGEDVAVKDGDVIQLRAKRSRLVPWAIWKAVATLVHVGGNVVLF
jgi:polysaccharide export outer membrane protein